MTSSQLILVSVTSALIAVFVMLLVATLKRARTEEREGAEVAAESGTAREAGGGAGTAAEEQPAPDMPPVISGPGAPGAPDEGAGGQEGGADAPRGGEGGGAKGGGAKGGGAKGKGSPSKDGEGAGGG